MIGKLIGTHFIVRFVCQKPHRTLKKGLRAPQPHINCVLGNFYGFCAFYISKLIPMIRKLTIHNLEAIHVPLKTQMACK